MLRTHFLRMGLGTTDGLELYGVSVSLCAPERGKSKSNKISVSRLEVQVVRDRKKKYV